jgi:hypothetical protein
MCRARSLKRGTVRKAQAEEDTQKKESKENLDVDVPTEDECAKFIRWRMRLLTCAEEKRGVENAKN